ncbi:MAG TPA: M48 family metallopeptidase [Ramlibacter sp.]|nr:M48 family metallopeptidase [Ramlibacter sp.]
MQAPVPFAYLAGYPPDLLAQVEPLLADGRIGERLLRKYPQAHPHRSDTALYDYVMDLKTRFMRSAPPLSKVAWDNKLHVVRNALGTHTTVSRVQGNKLKTKREIRIATVFRAAPEAFLRMIAVHELAHMKERDHDKAFYALCAWMEPDYHQIEFDLRLYLAHRELHGAVNWG